VIDYLTQSLYSDPGVNFDKLSIFPADIGFITQAIHHLFLHYADLHLFCVSVDFERYREMNHRYLDKMLTCLFILDNRSLLVPRNPLNRMMGICRDSALLCCSILRSMGFSARLRAGYVPYFISGLYLDTVIVEFFDNKMERWRMVDTRTSQKQIDHYRLPITFDLTDLPNDQFISAADAWLLCLSGESDPARFGSRNVRGMQVIANHMVRDLAFLNKSELLVWDIFGAMLSSYQSEMSLFRKLANVLKYEINDLAFISQFYEGHELLKVPSCLLVDNPFLPAYWQTLH